MLNVSNTTSAARNGALSATAATGAQFTEVAALGQKIGEGSQKDVFHSLQNANHCVCLFRPGTTGVQSAEQVAQNERAATLKLKELGFPVVDVHGLVSHNGQFGLSKEFIRQAIDAADITQGKRELPEEKGFNKNVEQDCNDIIKQLKSHNLHIDDLQFLIDENGRVRINDPRKIESSSSEKSIAKVKELRGFAVNNLLSDSE
ncbi:hypothetical protein AXX16_1409 [Serratia rubidaea]|uniref:T3SS effector protein kinase HopBF1 n=1 Tax=Serratia rubidaea TaxID=61652 RepID=UPI00077334E2|nr:T3SS effector protein kinase HopBF1 [Serratia rubidaea]AML57129.1 hypothetical protein AXX16_1409 [Serratia rubidaea]